jgi:hypothetical protein
MRSILVGAAALHAFFTFTPTATATTAYPEEKWGPSRDIYQAEWPSGDNSEFGPSVVMGTRNEEILTISFLEILRYASYLSYARSWKDSTSDSSNAKHYQTALDLGQLELVEGGLRSFFEGPAAASKVLRLCPGVQQLFEAHDR